MSAQEDLSRAEQYADRDIMAILYRQHADITEALERVSDSNGDERRDNFAAATQLMKRHEGAEQELIRPVVERTNGEEVAERNAEEQEADQLIVGMSSIDVDSDEFEHLHSSLKSAVSAHAESEEREEFPILENSLTEPERIDLGERFLAAVSPQ